jgi:hypothetical protein
MRNMLERTEAGKIIRGREKGSKEASIPGFQGMK